MTMCCTFLIQSLRITQIDIFLMSVRNCSLCQLSNLLKSDEFGWMFLKDSKLYCHTCRQKWVLQLVRVKASSPSVNAGSGEQSRTTLSGVLAGVLNELVTGRGC